MMKVLFLTLLDFSSLHEKGIYTDLLRQFANNGHIVHVISPIERRKHQSTHMVTDGNTKILKLRIGNIQKTNLIEKGISTLALEFLFMKAIKRYYSSEMYDLILYSTPPVTLQRAVSYIKKRDGARSYLLLKDIFPQNAVDLGMLRQNGLRGIAYRYFRNKEKKMYHVSDYIGCMSKGNIHYLLRNNPELHNKIVEVCPNSIEPSYNLTRMPEKMREKYHIPYGKTVFIYGGNLGKPQGVKFVIDCIKDNRNNERAFFLIVGSGTEYKQLQKFFDESNPRNALLIQHLPKEEYELLVASCDVGLIFLDKRFTIPNIPSRLLSYMEASMPVLAATDVNTDLREIITGGSFGMWNESGDVKGFSKNVLGLCDDTQRVQLGANSRAYLEKHYLARHSYDIIMKHFKVKDVISNV
ncbi:glycosyltransferase family 4 protein [Paenibacillus sp. 1P07SE]|uniref:glycosyltransferase family 4 protein n=1 Tax=Paenibacillus sp. 1P07SE TaxID=3132209 RepID=UPI0039A52F03